MDDIVSYTLDHMGEGTTLIVMSDHGFTSWRRSFHLNTWLRMNDYMALRDPDVKEDSGYFTNVDWSHTRAYGLGINALYINLRGRDKFGVVEPHEREPLMEEIADKLLATIDPETGEPAITKASLRDETYTGRGELEIGPDIIVGYAKGTRGSSQSSLGGLGLEVLTDNDDDWSGDHLMDHEAVPGVLLSNRPLEKPVLRLQDLPAAILAEFGIEDEFPARSSKRAE
jgi:predicted AlkP superfamily phosphohydrolase/phosphomutase